MRRQPHTAIGIGAFAPIPDPPLKPFIRQRPAVPAIAGDRPRQGVRVQKISVTRPCHQLSVPDALSWTVTGALRHRWSLPYQRASEEGLKSELELRLESLCGWRRMRAAAPADRRISFRQVPLMRQLADEHDNRTRNKNCRRSCQTRRGRALRHWVHRAGEDRAFEESRKES